MLSSLLFTLLTALTGTAVAKASPEGSSTIEPRLEPGICSLHLDLEYSNGDRDPWNVLAQVFDDEGVQIGDASYNLTLVGGVYGGAEVGLEEELWLLAWRNSSTNVALLQAGSLVIETGPPGSTKENCTNGPLVDGFKVESDCTFPCGLA